jgi:S1-C subfamily serine protease
MFMKKAGLAALSAVVLICPGSARATGIQEDGDRRIEVIRSGGTYLGVSLEEVDKDDVTRLKLVEERGALVKSVEDGSPAQKAGLKADDVILRFQGEAIHSARQLSRLVREQPSGRNAAIEVVRAGAPLKLQAALGERKETAGNRWNFRMPDMRAWTDGFAFDAPVPPTPPEPPAAPRAPRPPSAPGFLFRSSGPRKLGIEYQELGDQLAKFFKLPDDHGLLIARVDEDSPAAKAGLRAGDVILKIAGKSVRDGDDLREELRRIDPGTETTLTVQRDGKPLDVKVKVAGDRDQPRRRGMTS